MAADTLMDAGRTRPLGKRRAAVLAALVGNRRATHRDVMLLAERLGVAMSYDGSRDVLADLVRIGYAELSETHLDRSGMLRPTWKPTPAGREALARHEANDEANDTTSPGAARHTEAGDRRG